MTHPAQKVAKPRCEFTEEVGGGPHTWDVRCDRALGHDGSHAFNLSFVARLKEGTSVHKVEDEIKMREQFIAEAEEKIRVWRAEIQSLNERGEP